MSEYLEKTFPYIGELLVEYEDVPGFSKGRLRSKRAIHDLECSYIPCVNPSCKGGGHNIAEELFQMQLKGLSDHATSVFCSGYDNKMHCTNGIHVTIRVKRRSEG